VTPTSIDDFDVTPDKTSLRITGLSNGLIYTFVVRAVNGIGMSGTSSNCVCKSDSVQPSATLQPAARASIVGVLRITAIQKSDWNEDYDWGFQKAVAAVCGVDTAGVTVGTIVNVGTTGVEVQQFVVTAKWGDQTPAQLSAALSSSVTHGSLRLQLASRGFPQLINVDLEGAIIKVTEGNGEPAEESSSSSSSMIIGSSSSYDPDEFLFFNQDEVPKQDGFWNDYMWIFVLLSLMGAIIVSVAVAWREKRLRERGGPTLLSALDGETPADSKPVMLQPGQAGKSTGPRQPSPAW
jgi:hypothetical protein